MNSIVRSRKSAACKEKWKNLRAVFVRHMKPSANDPGVKKRKYYLTDFMQFVAPYVKSYSSSIPEPPEVDMTESQDTTDIAVEEDNEESNIYRPTGTQHHPTTANNTTTNTRKLKRKKTSDEVDSAIVKYLERHNQSTENTRKMFLLSLMDEVTSMTDEQWKLFKRRTLNLIDEITTVKK
ncbi:unnamed protein product [Acanthoscelides obtectus]|uniref:MADF domain-containing protein n=1 Tax=Acanthoscelides obtectus TaxID=200917 RepID=A0A9P0PUL3_ACAOB|nr:unnamed protein product [Acanthoscelides obtectus]CAK1654639.1 hypothetical protein AOBTE_LOCUS18735 [Acanthoscelides obtectus]